MPAAPPLAEVNASAGPLMPLELGSNMAVAAPPVLPPPPIAPELAWPVVELAVGLPVADALAVCVLPARSTTVMCSAPECFTAFVTASCAMR